MEASEVVVLLVEDVDEKSRAAREREREEGPIAFSSLQSKSPIKEIKACQTDTSLCRDYRHGVGWRGFV